MPLYNILKELDLPRIPSFFINTDAKDPIIAAAKFKRVLEEDIFFSVDYRKDFINNTKNLIAIYSVKEGKYVYN